MGTKYQAYSDYQKSDIEWSDVLPSHWGRVSLRWITVMYAGGTPSKNIEEYWEDGTVPWLNSGAVNQGLVTEASTFITEEAFKNSSAKWIPKDALVMALAGQGKTKGMVAQLGIDTTCNQSMAAVVPNDILDSRYIFWWLTSNYQNIRNMSGGDHRDGLNLELLGNIECPIPTHIEKQKIASFLDHETAKIDTLIEKQQQLIALLKEKRQAVISHAVTKGLNANAPMRDSGVEWLGEVPEHWDVVKLSYRYKVLLGKMLDDKKITGDYLGSYLRNTDVQWDRINTEGLPKMDFRPEEQQRFSVSKGDLIVCEGGEIGRCAIWEKEAPCFYQKALHRLRPLDKAKDETRFMFYVLFDAVHQERFSGGLAKATIAHLPAETFRQYKFAYPPYEEQLKISTFLDDMKDKFEAIELSAENQIDLLQERRTALISAAVTGKIDVRNWQAPETNHTSRKGISV